MAPRVFVSYSHDCGEHVDRVLILAEQLRSDGLDVRLDQWIMNPPEGWPKWMERQLVEAESVLMVCTATYRRRFEMNSAPGTGKGATWEGMLARQLLYDAGAINDKLIPVLLEGASDEDIPLVLRGATHHRVSPEDGGDDPGYEGLYRQLTGQPRHTPPPMGKLRRLRPAKRSGLGRSKANFQIHTGPVGTQFNADTVHLGSISVTMPSSPKPAGRSTSGEPETIALFSANATLSGHHIQLEEEMAAIKAALRSARFRDRYRLETCPAATLDTVIREFDDLSPKVAHFSGHGDRRGGITLRGKDGGDHHLSLASLTKLFAALETPPSLAFFATCKSHDAAKAVVGKVDYAIGFEGEVFDDMVTAFSRVFYERLASHAEFDVPRAFRLARLAALEGGHKHAARARLLPEPVNVGGGSSS